MIKKLTEAGKNVLQFKVTLRYVKPPIWRRIQLKDDCTFWDLHVAIQDAMGWTDSHLHCFEVKARSSGGIKEFGLPDPDGELSTLPGWEAKVRSFLAKAGSKALYRYDFGDSWEHSVVLEEILPAEVGRKYPRCLAGSRACPPEDCGGVPGFARFVQIMQNPEHEQHEEMVEWAGGVFDPEKFHPDEVGFSNAKSRLKQALKHFG